ETAEFNSGLRKPYDTLTTSTIEAQYLSPIKDAFRWLCRRNGIRSPFADAELEFPGYTRHAEARHPLPRRNTNLLLETAASKPRPDDHWLPLLGFLTGCRLAELVSLQGKDLVKHEDVPEWIFDLRQKIVVNGLEQDRQLKTSNARRIIALPRVLDDLGFIRWARERPSFI